MQLIVSDQINECRHISYESPVIPTVVSRCDPRPGAPHSMLIRESVNVVQNLNFRAADASRPTPNRR